MKTRAKSALIMAPMLIIIFLGGYFLAAGAFLLSVLALREYAAAFGEKKPAIGPMMASLVLLYAGYAVIEIAGSSFEFGSLLFESELILWFIVAWIFVSLFLCFLSMFDIEKRDLTQGIASITGVLYINFIIFHLVIIDNMFSSVSVIGSLEISGWNSFVWLVVLSAFGADIFAYFTGTFVGKHKLCPSISPKKTVEGAIGGVVGSIVLCALFAHFLMRDNLTLAVLFGAVGGVVSQFGDLTASVMKRKLGVKDWGTLIPGHGGILDRIDSIMFAAPVACYILAGRFFIETFKGM